MSTPREPLQVKGHNGTVVFDGAMVAIQRTGFLARTTVGKGEKRIPVRALTAVQLKPAGAMMNGYIQFTLSGGSERRAQFGRQTADAVSDENSVVFTRAQQPGFEQLREAIEHVMAAPPAPVYAQPQFAPTPPPTAPDPIAQLERLAAMHRSGALTDEEFTAAKRNLIGRLN